MEEEEQLKRRIYKRLETEEQKVEKSREEDVNCRERIETRNGGRGTVKKEGRIREQQRGIEGQRNGGKDKNL